MRTLRHHLRASGIALAAIVGMLSMVGEASARATSGASEARKACCVAPTPADCCCCPAKADPRPASAGPQDPSIASGVRLAASDRPCGCRADTPAAPASKPESSSRERRPERADEASVATAFVPYAPGSFARSVPPTGSPPSFPLSFLISRLRI